MYYLYCTNICSLSKYTNFKHVLHTRVSVVLLSIEFNLSLFNGDSLENTVLFQG